MYAILPLFPTFLHLEIAIPKSGYSLLVSLPSSSPGWTQMPCRAPVLPSGCGWPSLPCLWVQVEWHPLPHPSLPHRGSFLCWSAPEPCKLSSAADIHTWSRFQGNIRNFTFCRSLEVSQRSSRSSLTTTGNLPRVAGYCLKGSQAAGETMNLVLVLVVKHFSLCLG